MSRDGAPLARDASPTLIGVEHFTGRRVVVGAPPTGIDFNPSGRTLAEAYADRVDRAAQRLNDLFVKWLREKWTDVAPEDQKEPTDAERSFIVDWQPWFARWKSEFERFHLPEWVFKPAPSEIWLETQQFDEELEAFRKRFELLTKDTTVKAPPAGGDPNGGHEDPGGIDQPGILDGLGITGAFGSVATIVIGGAIVVAAIAFARR